MKRLIGALVMVAATVAGVSSARAECTDPTETFVTTVTRTFSAGSAWSIGVSHRACEGLAIGPVFFTPAGGVQQEVLFRGTISEVHVPYHTGTPRFLDATASTNGLGAGAVALAAAECAGALFDANHICVQNADGGYGWKFQSSFRTAQAVEIFMSSQLGNYNYINKWTFHDDGSIEPQVGLTGRLEEYGFTAAYLPFGTQLNPAGAAPTVGKSHMHNFYYRLDFDIGGSGNDAVSRLSYNQFFGNGPDGPCTVAGQCGTNTLTQILTEQAQAFSTTEQTSWVVYDKSIVNADGRSIGYEIEPKITGLWRGMTSTTEPWSNADLWVTTYNGCERYAVENFAPHLDASCVGAAQNLNTMLNGTSVDGVDLVVWYVNRFQHVPRDENQLNMPIEWTGFTIEPRSFYFQNPAP